MTKLKAHFSPKANVAAETSRFNQCHQQDNESVKDFANRLKRLAATCEFGNHLNRALRDQFVQGLKSRPLTKKLLMEDKSFADALAMAEPAETSATDLMTSSASLSHQTVNAVRPPAPTQSLVVSQQEIVVLLTSVGGVGANGMATDNNAQHMGNTVLNATNGIISDQSVIPKTCTVSRIHLSPSGMVQTQLTSRRTTMVNYSTLTRLLLARLRINPDLVPQWIHTCARCKSATPLW